MQYLPFHQPKCVPELVSLQLTTRVEKNFLTCYWLATLESASHFAWSYSTDAMAIHFRMQIALKPAKGGERGFLGRILGGAGRWRGRPQSTLLFVEELAPAGFACGTGIPTRLRFPSLGLRRTSGVDEWKAPRKPLVSNNSDMFASQCNLADGNWVGGYGIET